MAKAISLNLSGDAELEKKFSELEFKFQKKIATKAIDVAAKDVLVRTRSLVPVDSGRLRRSLKKRAIKRTRNRIGRVIQTGSREELGIEPTDNSYYPAALEYGDSRRGIPPKSFLRRAVDTMRIQTLKTIVNEVRKGINKIATAK
jgi:HK97 gp10 family phage protein